MTASSRPGARRARISSTIVLAPEEEPPVVGLEGEQTAIRGLAGGQRRADPGSLERVDPLRRADSAQPVRTEVDELAAGREVSGHERGRRRGHEDLAAVRLSAQPGGEVQGRPEVVGSAALGLAGMQSEADRETQPTGPLLLLQGMGGGNRSVERLRRRLEHRDRRVALAHRLQEPPAARLHLRGDDLVVADERLGHRRGIAFPQRRRALDVG